MYPDYESFAWVAYPEFLIFALILSGISGVVASALLRLRIRGSMIARDASLGGFVSLVVVYALGRMDFEYTFMVRIPRV